VSIDQLPDEVPTKAAPGELVLIQLFVNTLDKDDLSDDIGSPDRLRGWFADRGLMKTGDAVSPADVKRAQEVREAMRALALANNGGDLDAEAVATLNSTAERAGLVVRFREDGVSELAPEAAGVDGALGRLLGILYTARAEGTWARLKACREHTCEWVFYDRSKNRSGAWCKMEVCGNRSKARAYRERRRPE